MLFVVFLTNPSAGSFD